MMLQRNSLPVSKYGIKVEVGVEVGVAGTWW